MLLNKPTTATKDPEGTRGRILEAALSIFSRKGYHDASVDEIVEASHTSKGSVYFHFPNKQAVFLALLDKFASLLERRINEAIPGEAIGMARVRAALQACLETFGKYRPLAKIMLVQAVGLGAAFEDKRLEVNNRFVTLIQRHLDQAVAVGDIEPIDTSVVARAWMGAIYEVVIHWVYTGEPAPERIMSTLLPMLLRSVGFDQLRPLATNGDETPTHTLHWLTRRIDPIDLVDALRAAPADAPRLFWRHEGYPAAYAGWGAVATVRANGLERFTQIERDIARLFAGGQGERGETAPRLFGGFAFRPRQMPSGMWQPFGGAYFALPEVLVTQTAEGTWLTVSALLDADEDAHPRLNALIDEALYHLAGLPARRATPGITRVEDELNHEAWDGMIERTTARIHAGEFEKVVLSRTRDLVFDGAVPVEEAVSHLSAAYPDCFTFVVEPERGHAFFGATPELLAEVHGEQLSTMALAGSRKRGATPSEDDALAQDMLHNPKEREEHAVVVEGLRGRLAPLSKTVHAPDTPTILKLRNIQHLYTPVSAELDAEYGVLAMAKALHPTPAMGGYPRAAALAALDGIEPHERGWYAAPVGWVDAHGNGLFAVAIRSAVAAGKTARLYAGAGILADSTPDREWDETALKFRPLMEALGAEK